jgi:hypothetical protein
MVPVGEFPAQESTSVTVTTSCREFFWSDCFSTSAGTLPCLAIPLASALLLVTFPFDQGSVPASPQSHLLCSFGHRLPVEPAVVVNFYLPCPRRFSLMCVAIAHQSLACMLISQDMRHGWPCLSLLTSLSSSTG